MDSDERTDQFSTVAEQMLGRVGEAVLNRLRLAMPTVSASEDSMRFVVDSDTTSHPPSVELHFENTFEVRQAYTQLPSLEQADLFSALQSTTRHTLLQAEPDNKLAERDVDAYVFRDQSAVEVTADRHRLNDPFFLPDVRAINWQRPELLVGDQRFPTEQNLYRLGYQETARTTDTTFYRHYDPTMPLVGYGFADGHHHLTIFNAGKIPTLLTIAEPGQSVNLRQARIVQHHHIAQEPGVSYRPVDTRYPAVLLEQATAQHGVTLTDENARRLLNGQKTDVIETGNGGKGKLYVLNTPDVGPQLILQDVQPTLVVRESYLGHVFTEKDKQNLQKYGDMGRVVELTDKHTSQKFAGFIGVDKETQTLTALRVDQIRPKIERMSQLKGVPLNAEHKQRLVSGNAVRLDNMTSKAGTSFSAFVRVSAASRGLRFDPIPTKQSSKKALTNQTISPADPAALKSAIRQASRVKASKQAS